MKYLLMLLFLLPACHAHAQQFAEPLDAALLLMKPDKPGRLVLADYLTALGDVKDYDLIVLLSGNRMTMATVVGLKGVGTGIIDPAGGPAADHAEIVCRTSDMLKARGKAGEAVVIPVDPKKYEMLASFAWRLTKNQKVGIQSANFGTYDQEVWQCYFLVNSRLHDKDARPPAMLGGYLLNPVKDSVAESFLQMVSGMVGRARKAVPGR